MTKQTLKKLAPSVVAIVIIGCISFYGGIHYARNKATTATQDTGGFANLSAEERQARMANGGFNGGGRTNGTRTNGGGAVAGEILSKDGTSITIKLRDGGSKIVFLSGSTEIIKTVAGSANDLVTGTQVTAMGTANSDGSINAQSIQLRTGTQQPK